MCQRRALIFFFFKLKLHRRTDPVDHLIISSSHHHYRSCIAEIFSLNSHRSILKSSGLIHFLSLQYSGAFQPPLRRTNKREASAVTFRETSMSAWGTATTFPYWKQRKEKKSRAERALRAFFLPSPLALNTGSLEVLATG